MTRGRWVMAALGLVLVLSSGFAYWKHQQDPSICESAKDARDALLGRPFEGGRSLSVFVLGDSYTQGSGPAGPGAAWPAKLAELADATVTVDGMSSTGYTTAGFCSEEPFTYADRLAEDDVADEDVLVVQGSVNDGLTGDPAAVEAGAVAALAEAQGVPRIIVVGPPEIPALDADGARVMDRGLAAAARAQGAVYVSLLGEGIPIGEDGVHPTDAGQERIAQLVAEVLR